MSNWSGDSQLASDMLGQEPPPRFQVPTYTESERNLCGEGSACSSPGSPFPLPSSSCFSCALSPCSPGSSSSLGAGACACFASWYSLSAFSISCFSFSAMAFLSTSFRATSTSRTSFSGSILSSTSRILGGRRSGGATFSANIACCLFFDSSSISRSFCPARSSCSWDCFTYPPRCCFSCGAATKVCGGSEDADEWGRDLREERARLSGRGGISAAEEGRGSCADPSKTFNPSPVPPSSARSLSPSPSFLAAIISSPADDSFPSAPCGSSNAEVSPLALTSPD
mmetsp:Transcript_35572/g.111290  ORF Transcript_35572/g.111290 Transcript_35572/m.111290 type:complete len:283 (-) Transcript_35572:157-1005(-)